MMHPLKIVRKKVQLFAFSALLSLLGLAWPQSARAQFIGDVGLQTVNPLLANGATCTGSAQSFVVQNIGQIGHQATATSTAASLTMEIDATDASGATYRISNPQISFSNGTPSAYIVQANGYYPKVSVVVTCTAAATFSLTYAGAQTAFNSVIGPPGGTSVPIGGSLAANVQGVVLQNQSGAQVDPIIDGGLELALNANFLTSGIDNFGTGQQSIPAGSAGTFTIGTAPTPSKSGDIAIAFDGNQGDNGVTTVLAPWTVLASASNSPFTVATLNNIGTGQVYQRSYTNSTPGGTELIVFVEFATQPATAIRQAAANSAATISFTSNTLAGSTILIGVQCTANTTPCTVSGVTDTQGLTYKLVAAVTTAGSSNLPGTYVFASTTPATAAADTLTPAFSVGSGRANSILEIANPPTAGLTQLAVSVQSDATGATVERQDAQFPNQFVCNVPISTATTTQCQAAPTTINGVPVRAYVTDVQYNTTTAGAGSLLQLVTGTGTNCGTGTANLSAITYSGAAIALQNTLGMRTPLFAPLQNAVCVKQTGATPSTTTVEVHGFFAP